MSSILLLAAILAVKPQNVRVTSGFWFDRIETNRIVTLRTCFDKCNETPRIANFTNAARRAWGTFKGIPFDDSDVYKVMEGAAYVQGRHPDPELERYMDWLIGQIALAQETDGYLYTARTLGFAYAQKGDLPWQFGMMGPTRWSNLRSSHEFYNVGHLYEAAVAWYEATGKTNLLVVAEKSFNLLNRTFGPAPDQLKDTSGHEEIELALCRLYRLKGERKYLDFCRFLLDMRGRRDLRPWAGRADIQDHLPVLEQTEAIGHAVRAGYLYCGMADYAFASGDAQYIKVITGLWKDVVSSKLALHGGIGSRREYVHPKYGKLWEAFNEPYGLPNDSGESYYETCAAIANSLWNERLFRATGESKYVDVLERTVYNGFASGVSLTGDEFFYPNPLAATNGCVRQKWFGCSCCPVNDVRFIPQIPGFAFARKDSTVYWNLFLNGTADIDGLKVAVATDYPWSGKISLRILALSQPSTLNPQPSTLKIRIPGWACGRPVPSDLYVQTAPSSFADVLVAVNGLAVNGCPGPDGYLDIGRDWKVGDTVTLDIPMPVKRIRAHERLTFDRGRMAVERGPIVYCAEGVDNGGKAYDAVLPENATFEDAQIMIGDRRYPALKASNGLVLVPYALWDNRQPGNEMQVWFRERMPVVSVEAR